MILTIWSVEGGEQAELGVKDNCPVSMPGIQLCEGLRVCELMSYFIHCGCVVIVPADGIIEIMGIQTEVQLIRFLSCICNGVDILSR